MGSSSSGSDGESLGVSQPRDDSCGSGGATQSLDQSVKESSGEERMGR